MPVGRPRTRPDTVAADRDYSSKGNRAYLRRRRITAVIPEKIDQPHDPAIGGAFHLSARTMTDMTCRMRV
jgi:hypothetical protein